MSVFNGRTRLFFFVMVHSDMAFWYLYWQWHIRWILLIHNSDKIELICCFIPTILSQYEATGSAVFIIWSQDAFSTLHAVREWVLALFSIKEWVPEPSFCIKTVVGYLYISLSQEFFVCWWISHLYTVLTMYLACSSVMAQFLNDVR